jgi:hypothetical protein
MGAKGSASSGTWKRPMPFVAPSVRLATTAQSCASAIFDLPYLRLFEEMTMWEVDMQRRQHYVPHWEDEDWATWIYQTIYCHTREAAEALRRQWILAYPGCIVDVRGPDES